MGMQNEQNIENWLGWIFDFYYQNREIATFIPPYVSIQKPYVCNETHPRFT